MCVEINGRWYCSFLYRLLTASSDTFFSSPLTSVYYTRHCSPVSVNSFSHLMTKERENLMQYTIVTVQRARDHFKSPCIASAGELGSCGMVGGIDGCVALASNMWKHALYIDFLKGPAWIKQACMDGFWNGNFMLDKLSVCLSLLGMLCWVEGNSCIDFLNKILFVGGGGVLWRCVLGLIFTLILWYEGPNKECWCW